MLTFFMSHWYVFFIAALSGLLLLWPLVSETLSGVKKMGPQEAVQLINRRHAFLLDVRDVAEVAAGKIAQSRNIPLRDLEGRLTELSKNKEKPLLVYCQSGTRSAAAAAILQKNGFTEVYSLEGGLPAWEKAGLPITR